MDGSPVFYRPRNGGVMCDLKWILVLFALNMTLKALHAFLGWLRLKTKSDFDDRLYDQIGHLLTVLEWLMASTRGKR